MSAETGNPDAEEIQPKHAPNAVEVASMGEVTPEARLAAITALTGDDEGNKVIPILQENPAQLLALINALLTAGGKTAEFALPEQESDDDDGVVVKLADTTELSPEQLTACLERLQQDFERGIVFLDDTSNKDTFDAVLEEDKTAGKTWEEDILPRLTANDNALLKKAAEMPGGAELIGVEKDGTLVMVTRADENKVREPVIFARVDGNNIAIPGDHPKREALIARLRDLNDKDAQAANYWMIREEVKELGLEIPKDPNPEGKQELYGRDGMRGLFAAVEAVTKTDFILSKNGKEWRSTITDCGDIGESAYFRVVDFDPDNLYAHVRNDVPHYRFDGRGAVLVLRG